jgi:hypothetical protein
MAALFSYRLDLMARRRLTAAVCILALLLASFLHASLHMEFDAAKGDVAYTASTSPDPSDGGDATKTAGTSIDHCHGCTVALLPIVEADMRPVGVEPAPAVRLNAVRLFAPSFESPPPKRT